MLTPDEVDGLFAVIDTLRAEGVGIVLITHKMREVRAIVDRVTVLRAGSVVVDALPVSGIEDADLVTAMVGESVESARNTAGCATHGSSVLQLRGVRLAARGGGPGLRNTDLMSPSVPPPDSGSARLQGL